MSNVPVQSSLDRTWKGLSCLPRPFWWLLRAILLLVPGLHANANGQASQPHVELELIRSSERLKSGQELNLGVLFKLEEGWHVYWQNPGDTGLAPTIKWHLPEGFLASETIWPTPSAFPIAHLVNYGYEHEVLLSSNIRVPNDFKGTHSTSITAELSWLVCKEACIPGQATLSVEFSDSNTSPTSSSHTQITHQSARFEYRRLPSPMTAIGGQAELNEHELVVELYAPQLIFKGAKRVEVFVKNLDLVKYSAPKKMAWNNNRLLWEQSRSEFYTQKPDQVDFVVVVDQAKSYDFSMPLN